MKRIRHSELLTLILLRHGNNVITKLGVDIVWMYRIPSIIQAINHQTASNTSHDDVIKWKHFPLYWPFFAGNSLVTGEFPSQRPVTRSFDIFCDLCLNKRLSKQSWGWWFETLLCSLWRHFNAQRKTGIPTTAIYATNYRYYLYGRLLKLIHDPFIHNNWKFRQINPSIKLTGDRGGLVYNL